MNSHTVSTSSHNFSYCSTASPLFPSHFQLAKFHEMYVVTLSTPAYLPWIHLSHCTYKAEVAFNIKLQTPHGSTLLSYVPSYAMMPLSITLVFPRLTFQQLLSIASFHYMNLFMSPSIISLIRTNSAAYSNSPNTPSLANSVTTSTTPASLGERTHRSLLHPHVNLKLL